MYNEINSEIKENVLRWHRYVELMEDISFTEECVKEKVITTDHAVEDARSG